MNQTASIPVKFPKTSKKLHAGGAFKISFILTAEHEADRAQREAEDRAGKAAQKNTLCDIAGHGRMGG